MKRKCSRSNFEVHKKLSKVLSMTVSFRFNFILLIGIMLSNDIFSTTISADNPIISEFLKKSSIYISHNDFDSAGICIENARKAGMSKDSLFYLFSELYIQKSIFDTALALNYSIIATKNDSMYNKKFEQRYLIYSMLNLKSEADKAMDSLGLYTVKRNFNLYIPRFSVGLNSGYKSNRSFTPTLDPGNDQLTMRSLLTKGYFGILNGSIDWDLPWPGDRLFTIGTEYRSNKSPDQKNFKSDSLVQTWGTSLRLNDFHSFSLSYNFSRNKTQLSTYTSSNTLQFAWIKSPMALKSTFGVSLIGSLTYAESNIPNQTYFLFSFYERALKRGSIGISFNAYSSVIKEDYTSSVSLMYVSDVSIGNPVHFTISNLDTIHYNNAIQKTLLYGKNIKDTVIHREPNSTFSLTPSINNTFPLMAKILLKTSIGWTYSRYFSDFIWTNDLSADTLARNKKDSQLYNVFNISENNKESYGTVPINLIHKRRIDNIVTFSLSFDRVIWKIGYFSIGGSVEKTYSTLSNNSPIEIPDWTWDFSSSLNINFPFRKYINK